MGYAFFKSSYNTFGPRGDSGSKGIVPLSPAPSYFRNGSPLGNALADIPILGYFLGPFGDIAYGLGNLIQGNFGAGFSLISFGIGDFVSVTVEDAVWFGIGMTYGKIQAIAHSVIEGSIGEILLSVIIPHHGAMLGANWGVDPAREQDNSLFMGHSKLDYASRNHDWNSYYAEESGTPFGPYHAQWVKEAWTGEGSEPGLTGQALRLVGTPVFIFFSQVDPR